MSVFLPYTSVQAVTRCWLSFSAALAAHPTVEACVPPPCPPPKGKSLSGASQLVISELLAAK